MIWSLQLTLCNGGIDYPDLEENSGLKAVKDLYVAYSLEREGIPNF